MKVLDLQAYRIKREMRKLEQQVSSLATESSVGSASKMKTCFKKWLKIKNNYI